MKTFTHIFALIVGIAVAVIYFQSCGEKPQPDVTIVHKDTTITVFVHDTIQGEGKSVLKYTYAGMIRDTIIRNDSVFITLQDSTAFTATLDTIHQKDTLHLEFTYPGAMFRYRLNRQADSAEIINTVTERVTYIDYPWYDQSRFSVPITVLTMLGVMLIAR